MGQWIAKLELGNGISFSIEEASLPLMIGRDVNCGVCVPTIHVSRQHCELYLEDEVLRLRDTSTNGTMVGNRWINQDSVSINGRTPVSVANNALITVTPCVANSN